jgi:hypothetical protein
VCDEPAPAFVKDYLPQPGYGRLWFDLDLVSRHEQRRHGKAAEPEADFLSFAQRLDGHGPDQVFAARRGNRVVAHESKPKTAVKH